MMKNDPWGPPEAPHRQVSPKVSNRARNVVIVLAFVIGVVVLAQFSSSDEKESVPFTPAEPATAIAPITYETTQDLMAATWPTLSIEIRTNMCVEWRTRDRDISMRTFDIGLGRETNHVALGEFLDLMCP